MKLSDWVEKTLEEQPERIPREDLNDVDPHPWVTRHGSGERARIRLQVGLGEEALKYERRQDDDTWTRVNDWTMGAAL